MQHDYEIKKLLNAATNFFEHLTELIKDERKYRKDQIEERAKAKT